jgi:hypothetical protein
MHGDPLAKKAIKMALEGLPRAGDPEDDLVKITSATVEAARGALLLPDRKGWRHSLSPCMMAVQYALRQLNLIQQHVMGTARMRRWEYWEIPDT